MEILTVTEQNLTFRARDCTQNYFLFFSIIKELQLSQVGFCKCLLILIKHTSTDIYQWFALPLSLTHTFDLIITMKGSMSQD